MHAPKLIPREQWTAYFDAFSKRFLRDGTPESATVEILSRELGAQEAMHNIRVLGVSYDHRDQVLDIALEDVDHLVLRPTEIWTVEQPNGFVSEIAVTREDGTQEIIHLRSAGVEVAGG